MIDLLDGLRPNVRKSIETKGLLKDPEIETALLKMTSKSRRQVLQQIGSLGVPWETAIDVVEYEETDGASEDSHDGPQNEDPYGFRQEWRLDALKPNTLNGKLYGLSLGPERIKSLADDIEEKGQRVPTEILADGTILDGHSRYLAKKLLGHGMIWVVVIADTMAEAEVLRYIIDANRSQRQNSVREQVMLFQAEIELTRLNDPQNEDPNVKLSLDPQNEARPSAKKVRDEAARRAGFRSYETARRARRVFAEADDKTRDQLDLRLISVNRAHSSLEVVGKTKNPSQPIAITESPASAEEGSVEAEETTVTVAIEQSEDENEDEEFLVDDSDDDEPDEETGIQEIDDEGNNGDPHETLNLVTGAIAAILKTDGYEAVKDRCDALVSEIWEALGEPSEDDDEVADEEEEEDELDFLDM